MSYPKNSFPYQNSIASKAATEIDTFLRSRKNIFDVINIEKDKQFQRKGIDLLCFICKSKTLKTKSIEIKADTHTYTNRYFIEVIGNDSKGTPGGMLYTIADYIFYYFINAKELHVIERIPLQKWICNNGKNLNYREVPTVDENNNVLYNTIGTYVSREVFKDTVPIWVYYLNSNIF